MISLNSKIFFMANTLAFDVKITRDQLNTILNAGEVDYIVVAGSSTYAGNGVWTVEISAKGYDANHGLISGASTTPCIQPCP